MGIIMLPWRKECWKVGSRAERTTMFKNDHNHMKAITTTFPWRTTTKQPTCNQEWKYNYGTRLFSLFGMVFKVGQKVQRCKMRWALDSTLCWDTWERTWLLFAASEEEAWRVYSRVLIDMEGGSVQMNVEIKQILIKSKAVITIMQDTEKIIDRRLCEKVGAFGRIWFSYHQREW